MICWCAGIAKRRAVGCEKHPRRRSGPPCRSGPRWPSSDVATEGGRTSTRRTVAAAALMPILSPQNRSSRQREEEDGARRQHHSAAGRHQEACRDAEPAGTRQKRDGDAANQVAARACARRFSAAAAGTDDERLDQERADDLQADDDRQREQEGEEATRGRPAARPRPRRAAGSGCRAAGGCIRESSRHRDATMPTASSEQEIAVGHGQQAAEQHRTRPGAR